MKKRYLFDTDILIDCLRNKQKAVAFLEKAIAEKTCFISTINIAELYAGVREGKEQKLLEQFLTAFETVDIDTVIAQTGGLYRRDYGKSHGVGLADALIAATADAYHAQLVTLNKKHYPMLENVQVPYVNT